MKSHWYRVRISTYVLAAVVGVGVVLANVPGKRNVPFTNRCEHGWPFVYLERELDVANGFAWGVRFISGPRIRIWSLTTDWSRFRPAMLVLDAIVALLLVAVVVIVSERRKPRREQILQFRIWDVLLLTGLCSGLLDGYQYMKASHKQQQRVLLELHRLFRAEGFRYQGEIYRRPWVPDWFRELPLTDRFTVVVSNGGEKPSPAVPVFLNAYPDNSLNVFDTVVGGSFRNVDDAALARLKQIRQVEVLFHRRTWTERAKN